MVLRLLMLWNICTVKKQFIGAYLNYKKFKNISSHQSISFRDLKPENILLDENFHIKFTDFGTARILDEPVQANKEDQSNNSRPLRRRNSFVGTAQFVSPEILQGKEPHIGSDLWAFGCIVFQMLTGKHLFSGK